MSAVPTTTIGAVFDIQLGKMLDAAGNRGELVPYLANRNVQWGRCDVANLSTIRMTLEDRQRFALRPGDLLVCEGGEVGRTAVWYGEVEDCYYQKAIHRLRPLRPTEPLFAQYYMLWAARAGLFRKLTTATSIAHLTKEKLSVAPFPDVGVEKQRRIAAILDEADAIRRKRREALGLLDDLLRSTFLQMFGDPVTNSKGWPTKTLGQVGTFVGGGTPSRAEPTFFTGEICWATCKDMKGDRLRDTEEHISELAIARSATKLVRAGALLIVVKSKVLMHRLPVAIAAVDTCFGQDLKAFLPSEEWPAEYVATHLRFGQQPLLDQARGANTEGLTLDHLRGYRLLSPPSAARTQFAQLERAITDEKFQMERAIQESETLFTTLLHRAFTGAL